MIKTERLILRRFTKEDLDAVHVLRGDAEIMRFIKKIETRAETADWLQMVSSRWEGEKFGFNAVVLKKTNAVIGWCGLWRLRETGEIEVGWAIAEQFWGQGFAVEAAQTQLDYGFEMLGLTRIVAVTRVANAKSRRVMEKLGMTFEQVGIFYNVECNYYSIDRKNYVGNRKAFNS